MKVEGKHTPVEPQFAPFSVTLTFDTKQDVERTLKSIKDDVVYGDSYCKTMDDVNTAGFSPSAKIYYAIKVMGGVE